jgi:sulfide:quinone oxidoreductase
MASEHDPLNVLIVGGGVAAIETLIALRELAGDRVAVTQLAPERDFVYRPLTVAEPFARGEARRYGLAEIAHEFGAGFVPDAFARLDPEARAVTIEGGEPLEYDVLVLAVGARQVPALRRALTFGVERDPEMFNGLLADIEQGYARRIAFVVPPGVSWPLPLYELALMTAAEARSMGARVELELITPEERPLALFGPAASDAIAGRLDEFGVRFRGSAYVAAGEDGRLALAPAGEPVTAERIVALPTIEGPALSGVPTDDHGFIAIDARCRVRGTNDVFAAGDGTTFPVKQGGIACQMADAIAEQLAARAGADVAPAPFRPVLHGHLLTPAGAQVLEHRLHGGDGEGRPPALRLWSPPHKINGRYLSAWLQELEDGERAAHPEPPQGVEVEVPLDAWQEGRYAMRLAPYSPITMP